MEGELITNFQFPNNDQFSIFKLFLKLIIENYLKIEDCLAYREAGKLEI